MNNLGLWEKVCETDPNFTKEVKQRGGYTSIDPQYQIKAATEQFGCYGHGWGFEAIDFDYQLFGSTGLVLVKAVFFYVLDGKRSSFPINNAYNVRSGAGDKARVDPDFAKKAETNTMSKALSKLGFSADVFLGQFDDAEYVNMMDAKARIESGDDSKIREANDDFKEWFEKQVKGLGLCPNERAVNLVMQRIEPQMNDRLTIIKASKEKRAKVEATLYKAADAAKEAINNKGNNK